MQLSVIIGEGIRHYRKCLGYKETVVELKQLRARRKSIPFSASAIPLLPPLLHQGGICLVTWLAG